MILFFTIENTINIVISILLYIVYDDICLMVRKINYFILLFIYFMLTPFLLPFIPSFPFPLFLSRFSFPAFPFHAPPHRLILSFRLSFQRSFSPSTSVFSFLYRLSSPLFSAQFPLSPSPPLPLSPPPGAEIRWSGKGKGGGG